MMDWLAKLCDLPDKFLCRPPTSETSATTASSNGNGSTSHGTNGSSSAAKSPGGVIQPTTSEAILVAMLAARARVMNGRQPDAALTLVAYSTNQVGG
jgi:hypothetical protein